MPLPNLLPDMRQVEIIARRAVSTVIDSLQFAKRFGHSNCRKPCNLIIRDIDSMQPRAFSERHRLGSPFTSRQNSKAQRGRVLDEKLSETKARLDRSLHTTATRGVALIAHLLAKGFRL